MATATNEKHAPRNPWFALAFSLLAIGVGQVYSGRIGQGLVLFAVGLIHIPLLAVLAWIEPSRAALLLLLVIPFLLHVSLYFLAAAHAFYAAMTTPKTYELKDYNRFAIYAVLVGLGITYPAMVASTIQNYLFEAFVVPTSSMVPTISSGDRVLCNRGRYRSDSIRRGDLIVFWAPEQPSRSRFVKRVIGLPGDVVEVKHGRVQLNGKPLGYAAPDEVDSVRRVEGVDAEAETWMESNGAATYAVGLTPQKLQVDSGAGPVDPLQQFGPFEVPTGTLFVMGDMRNKSRDSRFFGPVAESSVIGRVEYCYFPSTSWSRFGVLK